MRQNLSSQTVSQSLIATNERKPFVNEISGPAEVAAPPAERPRILARRNARWARRAGH
ncbi:MAG: hypothetical protein AAGJ29_03795 [Pseudomonadota bacterium]